VFVFEGDDDNTHLVSMEASSAKKGDESIRSPVIHAPHCSGGSSVDKPSVQCCSFIESTSAVSPAHVNQCLLMSSGVQPDLVNRCTAARQPGESVTLP